MCPPFAISHKKAASNGSIAADRLIFGRPIPSPSLSRGRRSIPDSKALSCHFDAVCLSAPHGGGFHVFHDRRHQDEAPRWGLKSKLSLGFMMIF